MQKCSKMLAMGLALSLVMGSLGSVSAAEISASGDGGSVPVELTTEALTFSVTVPTSLPVDVNASGEVTVATDAKILNNSAGPVEVKKVKVEAQNDWTLGSWTADLATEKVGTKKFAMELQSTAVSTDGSCSATFDVIPAKSGTGDEVIPGSIDLSYNAHVAPQNSQISATIANVVFTIGWNEQPDEYGNPSGTVYNNFTVTSGNLNEIGFKDLPNETLNIPEIFYNETNNKWYKVTGFGNRAFYYKSNLKSVTIPKGVTDTGNSTFEQCTSLSSINLPNGLLRIGATAFANCSLTSIVIPDSVNDIGVTPFIGCPLSSIRYRGNVYYSVDDFKAAFNAIEGNNMV